jgi:hypothetical protein
MPTYLPEQAEFSAMKAQQQMAALQAQQMATGAAAAQASSLGMPPMSPFMMGGMPMTAAATWADNQPLPHDVCQRIGVPFGTTWGANDEIAGSCLNEQTVSPHFRAPRRAEVVQEVGDARAPLGTPRL